MHNVISRPLFCTFIEAKSRRNLHLALQTNIGFTGMKCILFLKSCFALKKKRKFHILKDTSLSVVQILLQIYYAFYTGSKPSDIFKLLR